MSLSIFWPHNQVLFRGKSISHAWADEMALQGVWDIVQEPEGADFNFFISDSQLREDQLGKRPSICYFWGYPPWRLLDRAFQERAQRQLELMSRCTRILVPSPTTLYQLMDFGLQGQICLPGVDAPTLSMRAAPASFKHDLLFISRIDAPEKNLGMLLEALTLIDPSPSLLVVGPGDARPYQQFATANGLNVAFAELTDQEKVGAIQQTRMLVHPSEYEGFGLPPMESLFLSTPVIAMSTPHMRWLLEEDAYYFGSVEGLARTIGDVAANEAAAREKARKGQARVAKAFTLERAGRDLWAHLHQTSKDFWGGKLRENPNDPELVQRCYQEEHKRNWAYGQVTFDIDRSAPWRFDPTWARHWRAEAFIRELKQAGAQRILDLGCGAVYPTILARAGFTVEGMDVSEEALRQATEIAAKWKVADKVTVRQGMAQHLPYGDGEFSAVLMGEILEHVPDPANVLAEALRVTKPGGRVIASTPIGSHHMDVFHIASPEGGWNDEMIGKLLDPYGTAVLKVEKIAEDGTDPSCYLMVVEKR